MKKLFLGICVSAMTYAVNASYLYWQVTDDVVDAYNSVYGETEYAYDAGGTFKLVQQGVPGVMVTTTDAVGASVSEGAVNTAYSSVVNTGYSYYIEMYNYAGSLIAKSQTISYPSTEWSTYVNEATITANLAATPTAINTWHGGSFAPVPEPTSAILMLFGAAFLGLKRKNRSLA